jgi:phage terminase large subunit-like protein
MKRNPDVYRRDVVAFIDDLIKVEERGKPFRLVDHQRKILRLAFAFDRDGRLPWKTIVYSCLKKSGKTTINAAVTLWWAFTQDPPNQILVLANDRDQAEARVFKTIVELLKKNPELKKSAKIQKGKILLSNGTEIVALASEYAGAAGSNHGLTSWDELWGYTSESATRFWEELTPVPTLKNSIRFITTYAGFENESELLWKLYKQGVGPEEHPDGQGTRLDPDLPIYANESARIFSYWDHEPRMRWQTEEYYAEQRESLRPAQYQRLHENRWSTGSEVFITGELWDGCVNQKLHPIAPVADEGKVGVPLFVGVDLGIKNDFSSVVAVKLVRKEQQSLITLVQHRVWKPRPGQPVDLNSVKEYLRWLCKAFRVKQILVDPSQALQLIKDLKAEGLPIEEFPQTVANVTQMGQALFNALQGRTLQMYLDHELRKQALNTVAVEGPRGWKIDKAKQSGKIDAIVALSIAIRAAIDQPASFPSVVMTWAKSNSGGLWVDNKLIRGPREAQRPDLGSVHPHQRVEPFTTEADVRLGQDKAARWRRAWTDGVEEPDTRERSLQCADVRCGVRWAAAPRDYESSFEMHWLHSRRHAGQPMPRENGYLVIEEKAKPQAPREPVMRGGLLVRPDERYLDRLWYECPVCGKNGNHLAATFDEFAARHQSTRHPA